MDHQRKVQVNLELGHRTQLRETETSEGFTHDWTVFVQGPKTGNIQHLIEKVVFHLHESYPKPKRVCRVPPYEVAETGSMGFLMGIEVHFRNKVLPKKMCFNYNLFLNPEGDFLRCEKLTFNNPTKEFKRKLIKAGGVMVVSQGAEAALRSSPDPPMMPPERMIETSHVSENPTKKKKWSHLNQL